MASFTLDTNYYFVSGDIGAYPASRWPAGSPSGTPIGAATNTQTISAGSVTFTGLTAGTDYYATDATGTRYVRFSVPSTGLASDDLDTLAASVQTALDTKPTATLDTDSTMAANSDTVVASQKAAKTYVDTQAFTVAGGYATADTNMLAVYRNLLDRHAWLGDGDAASTRLAIPGTGQAKASGDANATQAIIYIDSADWSISGKTTKLNLQAMCNTNATSLGTITFICRMYAVSAVAGGADTSSLTIGSAVSGSSVTFTNPSTSTSTTSTSGDFNLPANGIYALGINNDATPATDSRATFNLVLRIRHV